MFARRAFKTLISFLLIASILSGLLPFEPIAAAVAYAQSFSVTNPGDYSWTLEEAENAGDDAIQTLGDWHYVVLPESNYAVIVGHTYVDAQELYIPEVLGGADVVGVASGVFAGHGALKSVTFPGNIYAIGKNALPKGVVIRGYNASYPLTYASKNSYPFENISDYDFRKGVVDYADIRVGNFERVNENLVRLRVLEASRLSEGKRFFLVDPLNPYAVSYYTAQTISEPDESGFVTIVCQTPEIDELFYSYELKDEIMVVDPDSVVLYNGATLETEQAGNERWSVSANPVFKIAAKGEIPFKNGTDKFSYAVGYEVSYKVTASGGLFRDEEVAVEESAGTTATFKYTHTFAEADDKIEGTSMTPEDLTARIIKLQRKYNRGGTVNNTSTMPLGTAVIFSWAGIFNITMTYGMDYDISGNISVTYTNKSVSTYTYKDGKMTPSVNPKQKSLEVSADATAKVGLYVTSEVRITFVPLFGVELFLGVEGSAKMSFNHNFDTGVSTSINMVDTIQIEVAIILEITATVLTAEVFSQKFTLLQFDPLHVHCFPVEFSYCPDEFGNYVTVGPKNLLHFAHDCPYDVKTAKFVFPWLKLSDSNYLYTQVGNLIKGEKLPEPKKPDLSEYDRRFLGWNTRASLTPATSVAKWPYAIEDSVTFYAESSILHDVKFVYTNGKAVAPAQECIEGETVKLPEGDGSHEIVAWALVDKNLTILKNLPEDATTYTMPDEDITLCALCPDDIRINYHTGIGADVRTYYAARNTTYTLLSAQTLGITERARFDFIGWTDINGLAYETSIVLDKDTSAIIDIYADWLYNPDKLTAQALTDSDFGSWSDTDGNDEPIYSAGQYFSYTENNDGTLTITGFISEHKIKNEDGTTTTYTVSPTNLRIPSSIYVESAGYYKTVSTIGARAFYNLSTLKEVTLPNTITTIHENAFAYCSSLKLIDLQAATGVTKIPSYFASGCSSLKCVLLHDQIKTISTRAFSGCASLSSVNLNAQTIGSYAFYNCTNLSTIRLGRVKSIGDSAFAGCTALESLVIPDTAASVGSDFISGCINIKTLTFDGAPQTLTASHLNIGSGSLLEEVVIGDGVTKISDRAFGNGNYGFANLRKISLPSSLTALSEYALKNTAVEELELYSHKMVLAAYSFSGCSQLKKVTVHGGTISNHAFSGCAALETVILGDGVTKIGSSAFSGCANLQSVTLGNSIQTVSDSAFANCTSLSSLTFPDSVTSYGSSIISGCSSLTDLHIGGGCATLNSSMFKIGQTTTLRTLTIAEGVTKLNEKTFSNDNYGFASLETVSIPASVTTIGQYAFRKAGMHTLILGGAVDLGSNAFENCPNLNSIVVEGNISSAAFANCTALKNLTIRGKNTTIGTSAFSGCTNLETVTIEDGVTVIQNQAFYGCTSIKKLAFPDSVTSYGHRVIEGCTGLEELTIGGGQKTFKISPVSGYSDDYGISAFYIGQNSSLKRLVIREGVEKLGKYALANRRFDTYSSGVQKTYGYPQLESVVLPKSLQSIGSYAFTKAGMASITFGSSPSIGSYAFQNCTNLKSVTINNTVDTCALAGCTALETVNIKSGCSIIGEYAFSGCTSLKTVSFEEGVTNIGNYAFENCRSIKTLSFPDSITSYAQTMLAGCTGLENLTVGGGQKIFQNSYIYGYSNDYGISPFYIGPNSSLKHLVIREGVEKLDKYALANRRYDTYSSGVQKAYGYPMLESITLPESLLSIGSYAFKTPALKSITIPENVTTLDSYAFQNATSLETLVLRGNDLYVGESAFAGCTSLKNVTIAEGVKSFAGYAFHNCTSLKKIAFPDSVTSYAHQMLEGCTGLEDLTIGGGQKSFAITGNWNYGDDYGYSSFYIGPNSSLKRLVIGEGVETIGKYAFANRNYSPYASYTQETYGHPNLESVVLPESLQSIGTYAFYKAGMSSVTFSSAPDIGYNAFQDCTNLKSIVIDSVVNNSAFAGCASLENVTIKSGCTSIGEYAFSGCTNLKTIAFEEGVKSIGYCAFQSCKSIKTLTFPDSVTSYGYGLLSGCTGLEELSIGGGCAHFYIPTHYSTGRYNGYSPFYIGRNSSLRRLEIREGVQNLDNAVFTNAKYDPYSSDNSSTTYGYPKLESIILPESLTSIGSSTFKTPALKSISIPENVTSIGSAAFQNNTALETVVLRGNGLSVSDYAFAGCTNLKTVSIEEGVKIFGSRVFENCTSIKSLSFPDSVTSYGKDMLAGCTGLEDLSIGGGCPSFNVSTHYQNGSPSGYSPFYIGRNSSLKRLVIREGVQSLGNYAFTNAKYDPYSSDNSSTTYGYPYLESVILPESLTSIGHSNISRWPSLSHLRLSSSITSIGDAAVPSGATLCTNAYNDLVNSRALSNSVPYEVRDASTYPTFTLLRVTNASLPAEMLLSGISTVTTGTQGEEIALPDGYGVLSSEEISYADALPALEDPAIEGYVFGGWYTDADFTTPWIDAPMPACTLTLYARMLPISRVAFALGIADAGMPDETLPEGFSLHSETTAVYLDPITLPTPEVPGRIFVGWYKDTDFTESWSVVFDRMPETELILYGKFVPQYTARFALNLPADASVQSDDLPEGFTLYDSFIVNEGDTFFGPQEPIVTGYVFSGWYEESTFDHPWTSQTMPEGGVTIYGKLERLTAGGQYVANDTGLLLKKYVLEQDQSSEVYLPAKIDGQKVTGIGGYAFGGEEITFLHLPEYLESFHTDAFDGMSDLSAFDISGNNALFAAKNGVLYSRDMTVLYRYPQGKTVRTFTVPETVVSIAPYAFEDCRNLRTIKLPSGLTDIGEFAFSGCVNLTGIAIPDGVTILREGTFDRCSSLVSLTAYGLTEIAGGENVTPAFTLHSGLEVYGPLAQGALRDHCSAVVNGEYALLVPYNMRTVSLYVDGTLAETLRSEAGLPLSAELFGTTLPDGTLILDWYQDSSFTQIWDAQTDVMPDSDLTLYATRTKLFETEAVTLTMDDETTVSGLMLTAYNGTAKDLIIPETLDGTSVIALGDSFLSGVSQSLYTLEIGSHILSISDTALESSVHPFTGVIIADADSHAAQWADAHGYEWEALIYTVSFEADGCVVSPISGAKGTEIALPTPEKVGVTFAGWYTDAQLTVPVTLNEQGLFILPGQSIRLYAAWDGTFEDVPFTYTTQYGSVTITGYTGSAASVTIPETINGLYVSAIGEGAFEGCDTLYRIVLPDGVWTIGENAFADSSLICADLGSASSIGENAFGNCTQLAEITMDSVGDIAAYAFSGCTSLRALTLPETLYRIDESAFSGCTGLSEIILPDSLSYLAENAFDACINLENAHIGAGASFVHSNAFSGCASLNAFTVSGENTFYAAQDGVLFTADMTTLVRYPAGKPDAAYALPEGTTAVGAYAFVGASALEQVTVPASLTEIGENAFRNCTALTGFELPEGVQVATVAKNAFLGCGALSQVVLSSGVTTIDDGAFLNCPLLESIVIPASVTSISSLAFSPVSSLKIIGTTGSTAHTYALENHYLFSDPDAVEVESLTLSADRTVLTRGETLDLTLTFEPAEAAEYTDIRWMTTDSNVVIVTDGTLRAIGGGTATVLAIAGNGVQAELPFEIQVHVTDVLLNEIPVLARGETHQATAGVLPLTATDQTLTWESSDEGVFTVDHSGLIAAVTAGEATLTVTAQSGVATQMPVSVFNAVESIVLSYATPDEPLYAVAGLNTATLSAAITPDDATDKTLIWSVSDKTIASIEADTGLITALKPGEVIVTATAADARGVSSDYALTVQARDISGMEAPVIEDIAYTGQPILPDPVLVMDEITLINGTDYTLSDPQATTVGAYELTVTGTGNYIGSLTLPFSIVKATPVITYTGADVGCIDTFTAEYTVLPACETVVSYALVGSDESTTPIDGAPSEAGLYEMTITALSDDNCNEASVSVRVRLYAIDSIDLSCAQLQLQPGQRVIIPWTNAPDGDAPELLWYTDDADVVSVDEDGRLTAAAVGTSTITAVLAADATKSAACTITVSEPGAILNLPAALTHLEDEAFMNTAFACVIMGENVEQIGSRVFSGASNLVQIHLPAGTVDFAPDAFEGCSAVLLCTEGSCAAAFADENGIPYVIQ